MKLRRLIKLKELEEAEAMSQLEEAKTNHAVRVALGEDVRNSSAVRIKAEDKVEHLEENLSKLKSEYEEAFRGKQSLCNFSASDILVPSLLSAI